MAFCRLPSSMHGMQHCQQTAVTVCRLPNDTSVDTNGNSIPELSVGPFQVTRPDPTQPDATNKTTTNTNKIYIAPGILKRIGAQNCQQLMVFHCNQSVAVTCTVFEIKRDIGRETPIFHTPFVFPLHHGPLQLGFQSTRQTVNSSQRHRVRRDVLFRLLRSIASYSSMCTYPACIRRPRQRVPVGILL